MKRLICFLTAFASVLGYSGCNKPHSEGGQNITYSVTADPSEFTVSADKCVVTTVITCSGDDNWTVTGELAGWCGLSAVAGKSGDTISLLIDENSSNAERRISYTLKCGAAKTQITVIQKQRDALLLSAEIIEVKAEGDSEAEIVVQSNIDYRFEIESGSEWITHVATRAMQSSTEVFKIEPNNTPRERRGVITFTGGELSESVTVIQEAGDADLEGGNEDIKPGEPIE